MKNEKLYTDEDIRLACIAAVKSERERCAAIAMSHVDRDSGMAVEIQLEILNPEAAK